MASVSVAGPGWAGSLGGQRSSVAPWTFTGQLSLNDSGALELKVRTIVGAPRSFDLARRLLIGQDVLLVGAAPTADTSGRPVARIRLDNAIVRLRGALLPPQQWRYDTEGSATATVRPSRIIVLGFGS
jgi:hypothetical protein